MQLVDLALAHIGEVSCFRLTKLGFRPNGIIDIGSYQGDWSRSTAQISPEAPILMIEAQAEKKSQLEAVCSQLPHASFEICLLGELEGRDAEFNVMETGSSLYSERSKLRSF